MTEPYDAMLWHEVDAETHRVQCDLCGHRCVIDPGRWGRCHVRKNIDGRLMTYTYGRLIAANPDPIEKKPLFHVLPGSQSFSVATLGCNFTCEFCQNWRISQLPHDQQPDGESFGQFMSPQQIVELAEQYCCSSISYTYTEPTIFFELAYATAMLAHTKGLKNCFVSNGFMTSEAVEKIAPALDAINVDLKAFSDQTYRNVCGGQLQPVLDCLKVLAQRDIWVEVTTLVVPGLNDSAEELKQIAGFIANELSPDIPWHISRFHGEFHMTDKPATPLDALLIAAEIGRQAGLNYIYCGNAIGEVDENTYCPSCRQLLLERRGYTLYANHLQDGHCCNCNKMIPGVWG